MRSRHPDALAVELDLDVVADEADGVGLQIFGGRRVEHLAGADVEARGMQRALDGFAVEPAVGQARIGMGADIVGGEESSVAVVDARSNGPRPRRR